MGGIVDGWELLANAIIVQAAKDFRQAYRRLKHKPDDGYAQRELRECTKFFHSQYFELLTNVDGPALLQQIIREMDEKYESK